MQGQWPELSSLRLECNQFDALGIQTLTAGQWDLTDLSLDVSTASAETWSTLNLDAAHLSAFTAKASHVPVVSVPRLGQWLASEQAVPWPELECVQFIARPTVFSQDGSCATHQYTKEDDT